jgi:hypothetical protein
MKIELHWSELLIEKGRLDPLGIWRVGDRLIAELLPPMTTVVTNRPARYVNMYCFIFFYLNGKNFKEKKQFWKRFYEIESMFLCSIQKHVPHSYEKFAGQIGSEAANKIIDSQKGSLINFDGAKINNGWEANYKNPMAQFELIEPDFGVVSGIRLTDRGEKLASAYEVSIENTEFYRTYLSSTSLPVKTIEALSEYSCPCIFYEPHTEELIEERNLSISILLKPEKEIVEKNQSFLWQSLELYINFMKSLSEKNVKFTPKNWRIVLSTGIFDNKFRYNPPVELMNTYKMWEIYNLDSLFVFSLESTLSGFLEHLHNKDGVINKNKINMELFTDSFYEIKSIYDDLFSWSESIKFNIELIGLLDSPEHFTLEQKLIKKVNETSDINKMIHSFLLYVYVQSLYYKINNSDNYVDAVSFYSENSNIDGLELSLIYTNQQMKEDMQLKRFFSDVFLKEWVVNRQLQTRSQRGKEVAWFSEIKEIDSFAWEDSYSPNIYRADRSSILMSFLLNLKVVNFSDNGWVIDSKRLHLEAA